MEAERCQSDGEINSRVRIFVKLYRSCCPAAACRHARHRQSSPSAGIGSFAVSSMHQQWPERSQVNGVPQRAQVSVRRPVEFCDELVTISFTILPNPSCDVHALRAHTQSIFGQPAGEINREFQQWRVTRKVLWSH